MIIRSIATLTSWFLSFIQLRGETMLPATPCPQDGYFVQFLTKMCNSPGVQGHNLPNPDYAYFPTCIPPSGRGCRAFHKHSPLPFPRDKTLYLSRQIRKFSRKIQQYPHMFLGKISGGWGYKHTWARGGKSFFSFFRCWAFIAAVKHSGAKFNEWQKCILANKKAFYNDSA